MNVRDDHAGFVPVISGGLGYGHNINGRETTVEPLASPVLPVPIDLKAQFETRKTGYRRRDCSGELRALSCAADEYLAEEHGNSDDGYACACAALSRR